MQKRISMNPTIDNESSIKSAFCLAESGALEIAELMESAEQLNATGRIDKAISLYRIWLEHTASPMAYVAYFNLGVILAAGKDYAQAEKMYRSAIEQNSDFIQARLNLGNCLEQLGREDDALEQWRTALTIAAINKTENLQLHTHALNNLGRLLETKKNFQDAKVMLERSLLLDATQQNVRQFLQQIQSKIPASPSDIASIFDKAAQGLLEITDVMAAAEQLKTAGMNNRIVELYQLWLEYTTSPLAYVGYFNLGVELSAAKSFTQAEEMYRTALERNPGLIQARLNLGNCLEQQGREDEALDQWRSVLALKVVESPDQQQLLLHALNNLGRLLETKRNYHEAHMMLEKSFSLDPTQKDVLLHLVHLTQKMCRWPIYTPPKGVTKKDMIKGTSPLAMLAAFDDPSLQLLAAQQFVEHKYKIENKQLAPDGGYSHDRIRIGYLSSDLCMHAVSLLTVELFELHDREMFEVFGFCWSKEDGTPHRKRVVDAMDHFIRIGNLSDMEAAECIRANEIDILVDLQGLTSGARPSILSHRPAPLQITYLGFPGTTGLPWIDYVIADRYLIPEEVVPFYSEKPLYLPNCFQVSDSRREVGPMPARATYNLPEDVFVFCSFNNNYKYTPEMFAVWMHILKRVPKSVLWLLADNEWAKENLLKAAKKHGIPKERLIFAPREAPPLYLARYQLADLFLDTFPFNGGTTANDALFMGLPLLTLSGSCFAARMAGSLLANLGVPELIATGLKEYEEKAVRFAKNRAELIALKKRLDENRLSGPVFDLPRLVRDLEGELRRFVNVKPLPTQNIKETLEGANVESAGALPLVSILIPTHNRPDYFELALKSVLMQKYAPLEIIVSDNSDDEQTHERIAPYLEKFPAIRYFRVPGYSAPDNFKNCFEHARGEYINFLMDDDLFHPEKIITMMQYMLTQKNVGLVTSYRQLIDGDGRFLDPIPDTKRIFETETLIKGVSFGDKILQDGWNLVGEPTTALFRKCAAEGAFGRFAGRDYEVMSDTATWLAILSHSDCIYLPEAFSYFRLHGGQDQKSGFAIKIRSNIEWLQLFCDAHEHGKFVVDRPTIHNLLTSKLVTCIWYLSSCHEEIKSGAYALDKIQALICQATKILLGNMSETRVEAE